MKLYPINRWAYISESKVDKLLGLLYDETFVPNDDYDITTQVYNYLNIIYEHISENNWFIYSPDRQHVAFNTYMKPRLELGDDYIFAQFKKNRSQFKQEWELEYFYIRGRNQGDRAVHRVEGTRTRMHPPDPLPFRPYLRNVDPRKGIWDTCPRRHEGNVFTRRDQHAAVPAVRIPSS